MERSTFTDGMRRWREEGGGKHGLQSRGHVSSTEVSWLVRLTHEYLEKWVGNFGEPRWVPKTQASERLLGLLDGQEGSALTCVKVKGQLPEGRREGSQRARWDGY